MMILIECMISNNLAHIHKVENVDRDAKESINHCRNLSPLRPEYFNEISFILMMILSLNDVNV